MERFYRKTGGDTEHCFYVETSAPLTPEQLKILSWLLAETFYPENFGQETFFSSDQKVVELGPRMNFETAWSTNAVAICWACGLTNVTRLEHSRRYVLPDGTNQAQFIADSHDRMTECLYPKPLQTFATGVIPEKVYSIPLIEEGPDALRKANKKMGLGMDEWDIEYYCNLFVRILKRDPTIVECFQLGNANSEHSRHPFFKGRQVIDGIEMPQTLLEIVQSTLKANPANSVIAFKDNSSAIKGYDVWTILPEQPGQPSLFSRERVTYHIVFTAETHNHPTGVAPVPGAETGTGGRIRDVNATGRGGLVIAGTAGFCTGNLIIPGYPIPGEDSSLGLPANLASPLEIMLGESKGAWDYGNKFGEPVITGFTRTFDLRLPNGERRGWLKPIMFTGGIGQIDARHIEKKQPQKGMLIVQVGGLAYRIGFGGGAASSMISGTNIAELDFNSVQRGNAQMENKMNRVVRACAEMGKNNPILVIHDQGAGGPANVLTELVDPAGGRVEIRNIQVGDQTMSVLEIWGAEYQERDAFLIAPDRMAEFQAICEREKVNCEILGEITGEGKIVVYDSQDNSTPVDLDLGQILGKMPQKTFKSEHLPRVLKPLELPDNLSVAEALALIFRLPSVGSKQGLLLRVDRSVTGLVAQQQFCGPVQLPVGDFAAISQSHFGSNCKTPPTGAATSIGEQPIKMLVNVEAGARMAVAEALTNIVWALISDIEDIKCSVNWMWPAKLPGEGALLYDAAQAAANLMIELGIAADGGKDSLSMAAKVGEEMVKAPGEMVVSAYATMPDITKKVTPDLKAPGQSRLLFIDLAACQQRLGGSALAQAHSQIGDEAPDVEDPELLRRVFEAVQELIGRDLILAGHDRSDGGLITCLLEMAFAGNCGLKLNFPDTLIWGTDLISLLFNEELGLVIEYHKEKEPAVFGVLEDYGLIPCSHVIGETAQNPSISICHHGVVLLLDSMFKLRDLWQSTSFQLDSLQANPETVAEERKNIHHRQGPQYKVSFEPDPLFYHYSCIHTNPNLAVIREEGTNGDREMTSAFLMAGFKPKDVDMTDLLSGKVSLKDFQGIVFPGGFSYADVLDAGKGWAGVFRFNSRLRDELNEFLGRDNTWVLGVCNGCQLMALLGIVPWRNISNEQQPRFVRNTSRVFESRFVSVKIEASDSIFLKGMAGSNLGIWVAHGEGRLHCPDQKMLEEIISKNLAPIRYTDDRGEITEDYPFNPNGSVLGVAALSSANGRCLAMMPHPERTFLSWQWPYWPREFKGLGSAGYWPEKFNGLEISPWFQLFRNARKFCD